jgi:hypothetical protein
MADKPRKLRPTGEPHRGKPIKIKGKPALKKIAGDGYSASSPKKHIDIKRDRSFEARHNDEQAQQRPLKHIDIKRDRSPQISPTSPRVGHLRTSRHSNHQICLRVQKKQKTAI